MNTVESEDLITVSEARKLLNVSANKIAQLLKEGYLKHYSDPLDKRLKLVSRNDVISLKTRRKEAA